jgi:SAM-dependent methyltransferase
MSAPATRPLAEAVAALAAESASIVLARATLIGLPRNASRALVFGCGSGHTTAALAEQLGSAVGIDPSADLIACAEVLHAAHGSCEFVVGGIDELEALPGRFDVIHADLSRGRLVSRAETPRAVSALVSALAAGGIAAIAIPARGTLRLRPSARWSAIAEAIAAAGGRVTWVSGREADATWIFVRGRSAHLRLLPAGQQSEQVPNFEV